MREPEEDEVKGKGIEGRNNTERKSIYYEKHFLHCLLQYGVLHGTNLHTWAHIYTLKHTYPCTHTHHLVWLGGKKTWPLPFYPHYYYVNLSINQ